MGAGIKGRVAVGLVAPLTAVAIALFFVGICVLAVGWVAKTIWEDLYPILQFQLLMRRTELRIEIEEAGYEFPVWLEDDDEENQESPVLRLIPKDKE